MTCVLCWRCCSLGWAAAANATYGITHQARWSTGATAHWRHRPRQRQRTPVERQSRVCNVPSPSMPAPLSSSLWGCGPGLRPVQRMCIFLLPSPCSLSASELGGPGVPDVCRRVVVAFRFGGLCVSLSVQCHGADVRRGERRHRQPAGNGPYATRRGCHPCGGCHVNAAVVVRARWSAVCHCRCRRCCWWCSRRRQGRRVHAAVQQVQEGARGNGCAR